MRHAGWWSLGLLVSALSACGGGGADGSASVSSSSSSSSSSASSSASSQSPPIIPTSCTVNGSGPIVGAGTRLTEFAGYSYGPGNADGVGAAASFSSPLAAAADSSGNIYVIDANGIRKITPAGMVTTIYGRDPSGLSLSGIALDAAGNIYVTVGHGVRKISSTGVVSEFAGLINTSGSVNGTGSEARFNFPSEIAADTAGNVYVAELNLGTSAYYGVIRKITPTGTVTTFAGGPGGGNVDGVGTAASFVSITGLATDHFGNLFVTGSGVRKITPAGVVTTLSGAGGAYQGGDAIAIDGAGNIYLANSQAIRKITPAGIVTALSGTAGMVISLIGLAVDAAGNILMADSARHVVHKIAATGAITVFAGTAPMTGGADGSGAAARFNGPGELAADHLGNIYMVDRLNYTIRKISPDGTVSTLAGVAGVSGNADGDRAIARLFRPRGIALDLAGNIYVSDGDSFFAAGQSFNNYRIRKITPAGEVSTLVQNVARVGAADSVGNIYAVNSNAVLRISPAGTVTTLAGSGVPGSSDGLGAEAGFDFSLPEPSGIALDSACNVYVADTGNHTIRKISPLGMVTTLAGTAGVIGHADGTGPAASFNLPKGIAVDSSGNVYVADAGNFTIRKVTPAGVVSTIVGVAGVAHFTPGSLPGAISAQWITISGNALFMVNHNGIVKVSVP